MLKLLAIAAIATFGLYFLPGSFSSMKKTSLPTAPVTNLNATNGLPVPENQPEELGQVHWLRDLHAGQAEATPCWCSFRKYRAVPIAPILATIRCPIRSS